MQQGEGHKNELVDNVDENIRRQAIASHQLYMTEVNKKKQMW